jgi:hypothetical protein
MHTHRPPRSWTSLYPHNCSAVNLRPVSWYSDAFSSSAESGTCFSPDCVMFWFSFYMSQNTSRLTLYWSSFVVSGISAAHKLSQMHFLRCSCAQLNTQSSCCSHNHMKCISDKLAHHLYTRPVDRLQATPSSRSSLPWHPSSFST